MRGNFILCRQAAILDLSNGPLRGQGKYLKKLKALWKGSGTDRDRVAVGVDVGTKHVGLAVSDAQGRIGFPWKGFARGTVKQDVHEIRSLVNAHGATAAVLGIPIVPIGGRSHGGESVRRFIITYGINILQQSGVEMIVLWDESYSSVYAKEGLRVMGSGKLQSNVNKYKKAIDAEGSPIFANDNPNLSLPSSRRSFRDKFSVKTNIRSVLGSKLPPLFLATSAESLETAESLPASKLKEPCKRLHEEVEPSLSTSIVTSPISTSESVSATAVTNSLTPTSSPPTSPSPGSKTRNLETNKLNDASESFSHEPSISVRDQIARFNRMDTVTGGANPLVKSASSGSLNRNSSVYERICQFERRAAAEAQHSVNSNKPLDESTSEVEDRHNHNRSTSALSPAFSM